MTTIRSLARLIVAAALLAVPVLRASAQDTPPRQLPPASPPPPAPEAPRVSVTPPENAVALCNDQSFVLAPATPSACQTRGGLKVVLPRRAAQATPVPAAQPALLQAAPAPAAPAPSAPPANATMRCNDGTWLSGPASAARCDANGGLLVILPTHAPPPPPARRP